MRGRLVFATAIVAISLTACSSSSSAKPQTDGVQVDGKTDAYNGSFTAYFPSTIQVHAGDSVQFKSVFTGEPHTVTMGKLVDTGLPKATPNEQAEPPELQKIPTLLPTGPGDAAQGAAQPCYLATGDPPANGDACSAAQHTQPEFDGTQTYYNSGFLPDGAVFTVKLSKNIKAGTYNYFCTLHREAMTGKIQVVKDSVKIPTPAQVTSSGQAALTQLAGKLNGAATALQTGTIPGLVPTAVPDQVIAGSGDPNIQNARSTSSARRTSRSPSVARSPG
jgi:plastocyanin